MKILVLNSGSSSLKYQLFEMPNEQPICSGLVDRIGLEQSTITHKNFKSGKEEKFLIEAPIPNHESGLLQVTELLKDPEKGSISDNSEIEAIGHRVVHGGEQFASTTLITEEVKAKIKELFALAPLHNPPNYLGITVAERVFPKAKQVAVFDTAFHQTMPPLAYRFALPKSMYTELGIRAYGFHGTSHQYVSKKAISYLNNPKAKIITIHLGNGCSMTAIDSGKSIDTSMGLGPMAGLIMGTRAGDIDPSIIFHLINERGYTAQEVNDILNKKSGLLGLSGFSDMRDVKNAIKEGNQDAALAYELYAYRIQKYLGAYIAVLKGLDAIVFTAGIGENDPDMREAVCRGMEFFGINLDPVLNSQKSQSIREVNFKDSQVKIFVIPTNEELEIGKQAYELVRK
ncbi:acetate/propionate family kinase [Cecembia calidifontis]|jgi:acetate kinase|uniref:Acetate kinase n=1 Tax=Cecembia calidifontis TaxID=1187080 RepID=A0A4Q7P9G2_9BACT|nr:acetate kinase [Cecembia calidifontis]RZS96765.1 acetate kinase [Cecembia calidifontis]